MGLEYRQSQGVEYGYNGCGHDSVHGWDNDTDLEEGDVWGGYDTNPVWNQSSSEVNGITHDDSAEVAIHKKGKGTKSWLSMELQALGTTGYQRTQVGVGFAALESPNRAFSRGQNESNGGWASGFSSRKVKIPQLGSGASGSGCTNGWHGHDKDSKHGMIFQSAPVSMPVWPSTCGRRDFNGDVGTDGRSSDDDKVEVDPGNANDDDSEDENLHCGQRGRMTPHEIVDREYARSTTFSVIEGAGRTLKGSDLRRVRNAVWSCIGFED
ncbi:hypothetical protein KP509_23G037500 [Ceratopteris richardii]|nr:hypothetical protein KP509_23G037500 [Ceratopteris richardii]